MIADRAYHRLVQMIYRGRLKPGDRIVERDLARRLGVSRIPLRESLARLESEGLVRSVPNSATYVESLDAADVLEIFTMRRLLEPEAAALAAAGRDAALVRRLRGLCQRMTAAARDGDVPRLDRADREFHLAIVHASGNRRLVRAYESCHIEVVSSWAGTRRLLSTPPERTAAQHERVVRPIERGDSTAAAQAARQHVEWALRRLRRAGGLNQQADAGDK